MSVINYGDYEFSDEDENVQVEEPESMETFDASHDIGNRRHQSGINTPQAHQDDDDFHGDEEDTVMGSYHTSDEDDGTDDGSDVDEYANYRTDLEKYQHDQLRWNGIEHSRKYTIDPRHNEERRMKAKARKEEEAKMIIKPEEQGNSGARSKAKRKGNKKVKSPVATAAEVPADGGIHFDTLENLWYTYHKGGIPVSERATFHHWIRPALSRSENSKGTYDFGRERGSGAWDVTCFNEVQKDWGLERAHYASVMFEWERGNRKNPPYTLDNLYHQGILVIDYWRTPIRHFREIPLVISSAFEGGLMEPATRIHSELTYEDLRARMPPFIETTKRGVVSSRPLPKSNTFSGRARHFRERAGAISWDKREGSEGIISYIRDIVRPVNNSTLGSSDLTKDEIAKMRLVNFGTKPGRAKKGTSEKSKSRYKTVIEKAAGVTPGTSSVQVIKGEQHNEQESQAQEQETSSTEPFPYQEPAYKAWSQEGDHDELYEDEDHHVPDAPASSIQDNDNQEEDSMIPAVSEPASRRYVFRFTEPPVLRGMTEHEALTHPHLDRTDPRNHVPKLQVEVQAIHDALQTTRDHFQEFMGFQPEFSCGSNYISEYCNIQDQLPISIRHHHTRLRRRNWVGGIFDWETGHVEQGP